MNEGRNSEACRRMTCALLAGPWGAALVIACAIVILLSVPTWGAS